MLSLEVEKMSAISALLDDGAWTLAAAHRVTIRASRLQAQIRELILTYRSHPLRMIAGASDERTGRVSLKTLRQLLQTAPAYPRCDACLAVALDVPLEQSRALADALSRQSFAFARVARACARCGRETLTMTYSFSLAESDQHGEQPTRSSRHDNDGAPLDAATTELLRELHGSPTDLAKMVRRVHQRQLAVVAVSPDAIARWQKDARRAWERVHEWLIARGVRVVKH
jgi:hypothetical protein